MAVTIDDPETLFSVIDYHVMGRGFKDLQREALLYIIEHCADLYHALEATPNSMKKQGKLYDAYQEVVAQEEKWFERLGALPPYIAGKPGAGYDQAKKMVKTIKA